MVKDSYERKDDTNIEHHNEDDKSDIEVKGVETRATLGTFDAQKLITSL